MSVPDVDPTERFNGLADVYAANRPTYPSQAVDFLLAHCGWIPGDTLIDVGCGTGISTRIFAERRLRVIGIEPNAEMRRAAQLAAGDGPVPPEYRDARAEATGLAEASADGVLCAQAFHWFDPQAALSEFRRILKPGGWVALVWNERDESDRFTRAYGDILRTEPETIVQETRRALAGGALLKSELFCGRTRHSFSHFQDVDLGGFLGRTFSCSYQPRDEGGKARWRRLLEEVFRQSNKDGVVRIAYETRVYVGQAPKV